MSLIDSTGKLFGKINVIDSMILLVIGLIALGIIAVQAGWHQTSAKKIDHETDIEYTVFLGPVRSVRQDLFRPGEMLSITIRNQPRGKVKIISSRAVKRQAVVPTSNGGYKYIDTPWDANVYDYWITVRDHAVVTDDSYVTHGVKVKIGLPIEIEGLLYRISGTISDLNPVKP